MRRIAFFLAVATFLATPVFAETLALPVHGNWCGVKHTGGPVVDQLDEACMRHDLCTDAYGAINCGCDLAFMYELRTMSWPSEALYERGRAIYEAIALSHCVGGKGQRMRKLEWACNDHRGAVASGREAPGRAFERLVELVGIAIANAYVRPGLGRPEPLQPG